VLSLQTRRLLDAAEFRDVIIAASGGLDELDVQRHLDDGTPIDAFGSAPSSLCRPTRGRWTSPTNWSSTPGAQ
jgi:hypothetical protein